MSMWWYEIFLYAGWKFHFRLLITQCSKDDAFCINPSWIFLFFHPWLKTFRGAISVSLNVVQRQNKQTTTTKTHKKNVGWDKCQHYEITLLLLSQRQETRCRDAIWSKFVSSSRQMWEIPNTQAPEFSFVFLKGRWQCKMHQCVLHICWSGIWSNVNVERAVQL